jgi:23S rRNA pseudouridine2605 synthase
MRLNQYLARAGLGSRRSVEALIRAGRVTVDGRPAELSTTLDGSAHEVRVDGRPVELPGQFTYLLLHKPPGFTVTRQDPRVKRTVYELLPAKFRSLAYVGRLDRESEGVLLFTDDGELTHRLLRPEYGVERQYRVHTDVEVSDEALLGMQKGVLLPGGHLARAERVSAAACEAGGAVVDLVIREGKKREVRLLCAAARLPVLRLVRLRFGPVSLGDLAPANHRPLTDREVAELRKTVSGGKKKLPQSPAEK